MKWFKQDVTLTLHAQLKFMESEDGLNYGGMIIYYKNKPVGICNVKQPSKEFGIAILPKYQGKGIGTYAIKYLQNKYPYMWSNVFVKNPALKFYLNNGFKAYKVAEREYYKKGAGFIDTVYIRA